MSNNNDIGGASLAYLGDAVLELLIREYLVSQNKYKVGEMNRMADDLVKATAQSKAMKIIEPVLTEEETLAYKRGKNVHSNNIPKSAKVSEYRRATGMESLFGYLYLDKKAERMEELLNLAYFSGEGDEK